jgi:hypothetical protein
LLLPGRVTGSRPITLAEGNVTNAVPVLMGYGIENQLS